MFGWIAKIEAWLEERRKANQQKPLIQYWLCPKCNNRTLIPSVDNLEQDEADLSRYRQDYPPYWVKLPDGECYPICPICYNEWLRSNFPILVSNSYDPNKSK